MNSYRNSSPSSFAVAFRRFVGVATLVTTVIVGQSGAAHGAPAFEPAAVPATTGPPQAAFTLSPPQPYVDETVTFTDTSTGTDVNQSWDLNGDGVFGDASGKQVTNSYKTAGEHQVSLRVDSGKGSDTSTVTHKFTVIARPTVAIIASPTAPFAGQLVHLLAKTTGPITHYSWDLDGNGTYGDATTVNPTTRFRTQGKHTVRVHAIDARGTVFPASLVINVSAPQNPTAVLKIDSGAPKAGRPVTFDASGSAPGPGAHIISYRWDFSGRGVFHTSTTAPTAHHIFSAGNHTVIEQTVDSNFNTATTTMNIHATAGCPMTTVHQGLFWASAQCITQSGTTYDLTPGPVAGVGYEVNVDGLTIRTQHQSNKIHIDPTDRTITSDGPVSFWLENTPIGDIELWGSGSDPLNIHMGSGASGGLTRLISVGAGSGCHAAANSVCATLPGNFPLTGTLDFSIDTHNDQLALDANVGLTRPINVTGRVRIRADLFNGIYLDGLHFQVQDATFGPVQLKNLEFTYEAPGTGDPIHAGDLWDAQVDAKFLGVEAQGELKFIDGNFNYGSLDVNTGSAGIPVFPGVLLNRFAASFGEDPLHIGGGLGARVVAVLQIDGDFFYERDGAVDHFHVGGDASFLDQRIASATFDYYSDGFISINANIGWQTPYPSDHPDFKVNGALGFWMEDETDGSYRFQATGSVGVTIRDLGPIGAAVVVNNNWIAGCIGDVGTIWGVHAGWNIPGGYLDGGLDCMLGRYQIQPLNHSAIRYPHIGQVRAAGAVTFKVPAGTNGEDLEIIGQGAVPAVTVTSPTGAVYHPQTTNAIVRNASWASMDMPDQNETILGLLHPHSGTWTITPNPGSAPVTRLKVAPILPKVHVHTSVTGTGRARTLHWTASNLDGQRLTFLERNKSVTHTIGSTTKRSGHMALYAANGPAGRRNIEADLTDGGAPVSHSVVGHYKAPGFIKPGHVRHLRIRRHGKSAKVRWHKAARAQGYIATIKGSDGRKELRYTSAKVRHFKVTDLEPYAGFTVTVRAYYGSVHETGRAAHAKLAHHRLPTAVRHHHHHRRH